MTEPKTPQEMLDALAVEFPKIAVKSRQGDGKKLSYVDGTTIMRRLNAATNGEWNFEIIDQDFRPFGTTRNGNERLLLTARGRLTIPGLGSREHMGVQVVNAENGGEDLWKGAITDALKKAATLFGVGLELYGPDYEAGEIEHTSPPPTPMNRNDGRLTVAVNNPYRGAAIDLPAEQHQDFLDLIATATTDDDWRRLVADANGHDEPGIREAYWLLLATNAPNHTILTRLKGSAEKHRQITERVAAALRYKSVDAA